jgi:hypothetical protein
MAEPPGFQLYRACSIRCEKLFLSRLLFQSKHKQPAGIVCGQEHQLFSFEIGYIAELDI